MTRTVSGTSRCLIAFAQVLLCAGPFASGAEPLNVSGVYPSLTMRNHESECGTGAVVPWQGSLWAITYAPHQPGGSSDKLYEITAGLEQKIFEGSVGGTPANRMIHRESNQLLLGPYLIAADRTIRVIPPARMFGRLTGNARHLTDPRNKVYYATMEEGLYEVDVNTLAVTCRIRDGNGGAPGVGVVSKLPGYHGKGLYSGQGRLVYANNGDRGPRVTVDPTVTSGALAEWFGEGDWQLVRRNQFTEVTGPDGIRGGSNPEDDPIWAMGWDARSLILALLENKEWHYFRLPKGSHSYDGAHGWNTEWPRIREIGEKDLLVTMHGTFWRFPTRFSLQRSAGIAPRSNYLKVVGDFCQWRGRVVLGCDDSASAEFLNTRAFKAKHGAPKQSNSNLWFVESDRLDHLGPLIGRGSVWLRDDLNAGQTSDSYLFSGYDYRQLHLTHRTDQAVTFSIEVDRDGDGQWRKLRDVNLPSRGSSSHLFDGTETGAWVRLVSHGRAVGVTAHFQYRNRDPRTEKNDPLFAGVATPGQPARSVGLMRSLAFDRLGLVAAAGSNGKASGYYELNQRMELVPVNNPVAAAELVTAVRQPGGAITVDDASVLIVEDGRRFRLPKSELYVASLPRANVPGDGKTLADCLRDSLAIGAAVKASSVHQEYVAAKAVDGRMGDDDRWVANNPGEIWIELDLGRAKTFRSIWIASGWDRRPSHVAQNFDVQVKDGDQWRTLPGGAVRQNRQIEREIPLAGPVTARHLRLKSDGAGFFRIYEIALFEERPDITGPDVTDLGIARLCREVATERDLLNVHGTFYELPARNAQGLAKMRPIATHNLAIHDFCSHNGLLLFTGLDDKTVGEHIFRSADGKAAVWAGVVDDLWQLGKPRGVGGPWKNTTVKADEASDPYLMTAYDRKTVSLTSDTPTTITAEVDVDGTELWIPRKSWQLAGGGSHEETFPEGFSAYWIRFRSSARATVTAQLRYE